MNSLTGFNFITDDKLVKRVQWRFPRSRKTRIRRKWFRQDRNVRCVIDTQIYYMLQTNTYIAHPSVMTRFLKEIEEVGRRLYADVRRIDAPHNCVMRTVN